MLISQVFEEAGKWLAVEQGGGFGMAINHPVDVYVIPRIAAIQDRKKVL